MDSRHFRFIGNTSSHIFTNCLACHCIDCPVVLIVAWPIHRAALRNLLHPTMDNLVSLGSLCAFGWSIYANSTGVGDVYTEVAGE